MSFWVPPYKVRRAVGLFSITIKQNDMLLQTGGEICYLLKRMARADYNFQEQGRTDSKDTTGTDRRVAYIEKSASSFTVDPDTGAYRFKLWGETSHSRSEYPDIGTLTATVQSSGGVAGVWEQALDKYSFVANRDEYAFDIFQDQLDSDGDAIEDAVYVVFNTPPFSSTLSVTFNFGTISPAVDFTAMQPTIDGEPGFYNSLFGYEQWLMSKKIRSRSMPNAFLIAFPGVMSDFTLTDGGLLQQTSAAFWTTPPPYSPEISEHDVIVRKATGERYQVVNYTAIYVEDQLVSQNFDMSAFDPRSSIYNVPIVVS